MRPLRAVSAGLIALSVAAVASGFGVAQSGAVEVASQQNAPSTSRQSPPSSGLAQVPAATPTAINAQAPSSDTPSTAAAKKTYIVPAGTKVLLQIRSAVNTKSDKPGDGVYLSSTFPVVVGDRVMIPAGVYVQGVVDRVARAGRMKGRSQLEMHFTSIIFPNGSVVEIPGVVDSLPGAKNQQVKNDGEGTVEQNPDKTRNAGKVAEVAIPTGATIGTIGGIAGGHPIAGGLGGVGAGLATVGLVTLFTRGADVEIPSGTQVEMELQRPLVLEEENVAAAGAPGAAPALVPAANQPRPIEKPVRVRIVCPPGGLACD